MSDDSNTDDLQEQQRRLELATSRRAAAEPALDPETASLRAAWLALEELLEAASAQHDLPMQSLPLRPVRRKPRFWLAIAALAAAVLIVVTLAWRPPGSKPADSATQSAQFAGNSVAPVRRGPEPLTARSESTESSRNAEFAWDDWLDKELELADEAIVQAQQDQLALASASNQVQYQIESLEMEIEDSPL